MDADFWCRLKARRPSPKMTIKLLDDDKARQAMRERAYLYARPMVWKRVAQSYMAHHSASACPSCRSRFKSGLPSRPNTREADQRAGECLSDLATLFFAVAGDC